MAAKQRKPYGKRRLQRKKAKIEKLIKHKKPKMHLKPIRQKQSPTRTNQPAELASATSSVSPENTPSMGKNHPTPGARENSAMKTNREQADMQKFMKSTTESKIRPDKYTSSNSPRLRQSCSRNDTSMKDKAYNVVCAAIEYGFANNVIERKGDFFLLKNKRSEKIAKRSPTPGPCGRSFCACSCHGLRANASGHKQHNVNQKRDCCSKFKSKMNLVGLQRSKSHHPSAISQLVNLYKTPSRSRSGTATSCSSNGRGLKRHALCNCAKCKMSHNRIHHPN